MKRKSGSKKNNGHNFDFDERFRVEEIKLADTIFANQQLVKWVGGCVTASKCRTKIRDQSEKSARDLFVMQIYGVINPLAFHLFQLASGERCFIIDRSIVRNRIQRGENAAIDRETNKMNL